MRIVIGRNSTFADDEYVLPSSKNLKKQELLLLKICMLLLAFIIVYMCPYKLLQPIHESKAILQNVEEHYSPHRSGGRRYLKGLYLTIDNQIYYLNGKYILDDGTRQAVKGIGPMKNELQKIKAENREMIVSYVEYVHIGSSATADIVGIEIADEIWIDSNHSWILFCRDIKIYTALYLIAFLILIMVYLLKSGFLRIYQS